MKSALPLIAATLLSVSFHSVNAQIKGDPTFPGIAAGTAIQKSSSTLSPDLQKLAAATATKKAAAAINKPTPPGVGEFSGYLQLRGNNVLVDVTVKEDIAAAKAELQ